MLSCAQVPPTCALPASSVLGEIDPHLVHVLLVMLVLLLEHL